MSSTMRALSNVDAGVVKAEIEIAATPARVFQSLTDANELARRWLNRRGRGETQRS